MARQVILEHEGKSHDLGRVFVPPKDGRGEFAVRAADYVSTCFYMLNADLPNQAKFYLVVQAVAQVFSGKSCCRDTNLEDKIIRIFMSMYCDEYEKMMEADFGLN